MAGCLEPVLVSPRPVEAPLDEALAIAVVEGRVYGHGRVVGACAGPVLVEAVDDEGRALGRTRGASGRWKLTAMARQPARLRWGCDEDRDGVVPGARVSSAPVDQVPLVGGVLVLGP